MKKWYQIPGIVLSIAFLSVAFYFVSKSHEHSEKFRVEKSKVGEILNFNDRLLSARDWIFTETAWQEKKTQFEAAIAQADAHLLEAQNYGSYILYGCIVFLIAMVLLYAKRRIFFGLTMAVSFISLALLGQGVMNPILELGAYKEDLTIKFYVEADEIPYYAEATEFLEEVAEYVGYVGTTFELVRVIPGSEDFVASGKEIIDGYGQLVIDGKNYLVEHKDSHVGIDKVFTGRMYFYQQIKGIMEVIHLLWTTGNRMVAVAIGLFSIGVPTIKLLMTLFILLVRMKKTKNLRKFLAYIAKWSMADVFVVAMFLAYMSFANMSPGVTMDANVLFGLHYFMGYVILSITLSYLLDASIKEREKRDQKELAEQTTLEV